MPRVKECHKLPSSISSDRLSIVCHDEMPTQFSAPPVLFVVFGRMPAGVARRFIVIDPEDGLLLGQNACDLFHRLERLRSIGIEGRDALVIPVRLEMHSIT